MAKKKSGAKFKSKDVRNVNRLFERIIKSPDDKTLEKVGKTLAREIRGRTRVSGKSLVTGRPLPGLSNATKEFREYIIDGPTNTPNYVQADRSNLSLSGRLLASIKSKVVIDKLRFKKKVVIFLRDGKHPGYRKKDGGKIKRKRRPTFDQIAFWLEDLGFEFLGIDAELFERVKKQVIRAIRRNARKKK